MKDLYQYLESNIKGFDSLNFSDELTQKYQFLGSDDDIVRWEFIAQRFKLDDGKTMPYFTSSDLDEEGNVIIIEHPNHDSLSKGAYEYYTSRLGSTSNPLLSIRYLQILFNSRLKFRHANQGKEIIDISLDRLLKSSFDSSQKNQGLELRLLGNALCLSVRCNNYRLSEIEETIVRNLGSPSKQYLWIQLLLQSIYQIRKKLSDQFLEEVLSKGRLIIDSLIEEENIVIGPSFIDTLTHFQARLNDDTRPYSILKGRLYEKAAQSDKILNATSKVIQLFYAFKAYSAAKDEESVDRVNLQLEDLKSVAVAELDIIPLRIDGDQRKYLEAFMNSILDGLRDGDSESTMKFLAGSRQVLPPYISEDSKEGFLITDIVTSITFDKNKNFKLGIGHTDLEKRLESYFIEFQLYYAHLINAIFIEGVNDGRISARTIINFLERYSWLGKTLSIDTPDDQTIKYNWAHELGNVLLEFFGQLEASIFSGYYQGNYAMCTDLIVLKIEPILRDLAKRRKINTTHLKNDTLQEVPLEELIRRLEKNEELSMQDVEFFKFLYVVEGQNIRNNIAHGFMKGNDYKYYIFLLVLLSILRISTFNIEEK